jgi:hypothetical protein
MMKTDRVKILMMPEKLDGKEIEFYDRGGAIDYCPFYNDVGDWGDHCNILNHVGVESAECSYKNCPLKNKEVKELKEC